MPFYKQAVKFAKKTAKRVTNYAKKRYVKKGGLRIGNVMKDISMLKRQMNVEKKSITGQFTTDFAQSSGGTNATSGHNLLELTPTPAQGITSSTRNGNSIKLTGMMLNLLLQPGVSTTEKIKYKIYIFNQKQSPSSSLININHFVDRSVFSGSALYPHYTFDSLRNQENLGNLQVIKTFYGSIRADVDQGASYKVNIQQPLKLNHHCRFDGDGSIVSTTNRMYMLCVADNGSLSGNTGIKIQGEIKNYYVDN